jgi:hypothetical protein
VTLHGFRQLRQPFQQGLNKVGHVTSSSSKMRHPSVPEWVRRDLASNRPFSYTLTSNVTRTKGSLQIFA